MPKPPVMPLEHPTNVIPDRLCSPRASGRMSGKCLVLIGVMSSGVGFIFGGCSVSPVPVETSGNEAMATLKGDWDDIDAAAEMGTWYAECVWVGWPESPSPIERIYHLRHISDARGTLTVRRSQADAERIADIDITLECSMGRFGEPALERDVVAKTARRLAELRGVEFAPLSQ